MKEPQRLAEGSDLRAELVRSARADRVPGSAKARHVAAAVAAAAAIQARAAAAASLKALLVKALVVTTLAIAAAATYQVVTAGGRPSAREAREVRATASAPTPLAAETSQRALPVAEPPPSAPRGAPLASAAPLAAASSQRLAEEVAQLDRARAALLAGDGDGALAELARYHHDFPASQLGREATLLEIDALEKAGRHDLARDRARAFMRANPQSAATKRLAITYGE
ncbi:MAG TPA: hypothetical protein VLT33_15995 [Labilithrix sp.]|nr:hypothetical protein [Labilithrix sp.]